MVCQKVPKLYFQSQFSVKNRRNYFRKKFKNINLGDHFLKKFPLTMLILGQKSCILGPTIFKISTTELTLVCNHFTLSNIVIFDPVEN